MSELLAIITIVSFFASISAISVSSVGFTRSLVTGPAGPAGPTGSGGSGTGTSAFPTTDAIFKVNSAAGGHGSLQVDITGDSGTTLVFPATGSTATFTYPILPHAGDTLVTLTATQTLSAKTLQNPLIQDATLLGPNPSINSSGSSGITALSVSGTSNGGIISGIINQVNLDVLFMNLTFGLPLTASPHTMVVTPMNQTVAQNYQFWVASFNVNGAVIRANAIGSVNFPTSTQLFTYFLM